MSHLKKAKFLLFIHTWEKNLVLFLPSKVTNTLLLSWANDDELIQVPPSTGKCIAAYNLSFGYLVIIG